jgi:chaperonin GroES
MKLKPLHDRILIKIIEESEKTKGGIIIPDTAKEKPSEGEVVAVGPGIINKDGKRNPLEVKPGDKILFSKYSGDEVKIDGKDLMIIKEEDVIGILN